MVPAMYRMLADLALLLHLAFILFVSLGGLLLFRWPRLALLHLPAALWGAIVLFAGWPCPLTPLENYFRVRSGGAGYPGGFIEHYLLPLIYPGMLTRELQVLLGFLVLLGNALGYGFLLRRFRRRGKDAAGRLK